MRPTTPSPASSRQLLSDRPVSESGSSDFGPAPTRRTEAMMFLALAVLVWPVIAVGTVSAYGFSIWMYQLLTH